jgi:uncharacterized RmlC-like cupin family protein
MIAIRRLVLLAACALGAACASTGANTAKREATTVLVDNQSALDMNIYVLRGGERVRLGTANSLQKTTFTIPAGIVFGPTSVRFLADPIGSSREPVSDEITVTEGEQVELRIPPG